MPKIHPIRLACFILVMAIIVAAFVMNSPGLFFGAFCFIVFWAMGEAGVYF